MHSRRQVLSGLGAAGLTALAGCLGGGGDGGGSPAVANAPIPANPGEYTYARTGTAGPTITYYGNWKCPFCAEFSNGSDRVLNLGTIVTEYVEPGALQLRFRALAYTSSGQPFLGPDAVRAARAGLAVWNLAPAQYWRYHERIMAEQPPESETWATTDRLVQFAETAGVEATEELRTAIESGEYQSAVRESAQRASTLGVDGTPYLVIDGSLYSPFRPSATRSALETLTA
ncbi:MAG: DsbA family protein [Halobacteriaceae archaeon]